MFCKHILGVSKSTTTIGILLELGRIHLTLFANKAAVKNWDRIRRGKANELLFSFAKEFINQDLNWSKKLKIFLSEIGMLNHFLNFDPFNSSRLSDLVFEENV